MSCSSRNLRVRRRKVSSSGSGAPSDRESPWQTNGMRSVHCLNLRPRMPPTPIQFSGAASMKPSGDRSACSSGPRRARLRPSPAPEIGNPGNVAVLISSGPYADQATPQEPSPQLPSPQEPSESSPSPSPQLPSPQEPSLSSPLSLPSPQEPSPQEPSLSSSPRPRFWDSEPASRSLAWNGLAVWSAAMAAVANDAPATAPIAVTSCVFLSISIASNSIEKMYIGPHGPFFGARQARLSDWTGR